MTYPHDPREHEQEAEATVAGWRTRWALFAVVWVLLVLLLAVLLWPRLQGAPLRQLLLAFGAVAVTPPLLDYVFSWGIAGMLERRTHRDR